MSISEQHEADVVAEIRIAAVAAAVARATPGVERLQPDILGLVQQLSKELWQRVTGEEFPDIAGVEMKDVDDLRIVEITFVADDRRNVTATSRDVQQRVIGAVRNELQVDLPFVIINVASIALH